MRLIGSQGKRYRLEGPFARGGEATIWRVRGNPQVVAKVYHKPTEQREAKLLAMLAAPPAQPRSHLAIAWPTELLYRKEGWLKPRMFAGYLMPCIVQSDKLFNFYHPLRRRQLYPRCNWRHLHRIAHNLAVAVDAVNTAGHVVGDLNEGNILVDPNTVLVTLVDSDSFQIGAGNGGAFPCVVGKPEYTAPELQRAHLAEVYRTNVHDRFGLSVLIFQLLMDGCSPFAGVLSGGVSVERIDLHCIRKGLFPYLNSQTEVKPPPYGPPLNILCPEVRDAFVTTFRDGYRDPSSRISARKWQRILLDAEKSLVVCTQDRNHYYSPHLASCPWCKRYRSKRARRRGSRTPARSRRN